MRRTALLLVTLGVSGCAHTAWVRSGDRAAAGGNWEQAVESYARASELQPGSKRVARRLDNAWERLGEVRREQIRVELAEADLAMRRGDWASVVVHIEKAVAVDPESEVAGEVAWEAAQALMDLSDARLRTGASLESYSYALLAARLLPSDPEPAATVSRARSAVLIDAFASADAGDYESAWRLARAVRDSEAPELSAGVVEAIEGRWAAALHEEARRDESRGRLGTALVGYARAAAIGGDDADRVARERIATRLADAWRFEVAWAGSTSREAKGLRDAVERTLASDPRVAFGSGGDYRVDLASVTRACAQTAVQGTADHRYVSGTRRVTNPAWTEAERDARYAEARRIAAEATSADRAEEVAMAERQVEWWLVTDWTGASDDLRLAEADLAATQRTEASAEAALREASELLDRARLDPNWSGTPVAELESLVYSRSRALEEARSERQIAESAHYQASRDYDIADRELDRLKRVLLGAQDTASRARDDVRAARTEALEAAARRDVTPLQIDEDVWATFRYEVEDVTRTCEVVANVAIGGDKRAFRYATSTTDRHHAAHPEHAIAANPLAFADSDDELVAQALGGVVPSLVASIESGRDGWYADLYARGAASDDPNEATTLYAAGLLLDPASAPAGVVTWLEDTWNTQIATLLGG